MYPGLQAKIRPDQPAIVMARSGETITYRELDERSNRLAHLLRAARLERGDHYSVFMENHPRFVECGAAAERAGLYCTNINSFLTVGELAYIVNNSGSKALITSEARRNTSQEFPKPSLFSATRDRFHRAAPTTGSKRRSLADSSSSHRTCARGAFGAPLP